MSLEVRYAQLDDYPRLSAFLDTYWAKDHVYVRQQSLFDWTFGRRDLWPHDGYSFALPAKVTCQQLVHANLHPQADWPFSYPYGKIDTFNGEAITHLHTLGVTCAFCTEVGSNAPGSDIFAIRRLDCKDAPGGSA